MEIKLYDSKDIAQMLKIKETTVRQYFNTGEIKGRKIGKKWIATEKNLLEFLEGEPNKKIKPDNLHQKKIKITRK